MGVFKVQFQEIYHKLKKKNVVKEENNDRNVLEKELKKLEKNLTNFQKNKYYLECKQNLQNIYISKK